ncbi:MAG: DMT family transporter [Maioricimonas sp. JB049]
MPTAAERDVVRGRLLLLAAALLWSLSGLLVKNDVMQAIPHAQRGPVLACYRALFAAASLLPFVRWKRARFRGAMLPMVVSYLLMNVLYVTSLTWTTAAAAIFLQYTCTGWAFLLGVLFLGERSDRGGIVALLCSLAGIGLIVASDWSGERLPGNLMALGSGMAFAGVALMFRVLRGESALWLVFVCNLTGGLGLLPWVLGLDVQLTPAQWGLTAALGVLQLGVPYVLFARAVRVVTAQEAALITILEAVLNPIWVAMFVGELASLATWLGGSSIVVGLVLRYTVFLNRPVSVAVKQTV